MNRVCGCSSERGVKTYYQYTDSIHLKYDDADTIVNRYEQKYGLDVVGEYLCQFHVDFPKKMGMKMFMLLNTCCLM